MAKQTAVLEETPKRKPVFYLTDRCDGCHAEAYMRAYLPISEKFPKGSELLFCGHHARAGLPKLAILGCEIEWKEEGLLW